MLRSPVRAIRPFRRLTLRQQQVLDLLARGQTNAEIAAALGISLDGAKWHVGEVLSRLDLDVRAEAARWWRQERARHGEALAA